MNQTIINKLQQDGFAIIDSMFLKEAVANLASIIENASSDNATFRKSADLFAIRQFLKEVPAVKELVFTSELITLLQGIFGNGYSVVKAIYFDKPPTSNWLVPYHQDLTIAVKEKKEVAGFGPWTVKQNQYGVQPPVSLLQNIFTIRLHLDDTDENNGALKVIPASHKNGIVKPEAFFKAENEVTCCVPAGGIMLMRPLLLHASSKTTNGKRRRVIHLECSSEKLLPPLAWAEFQPIETAC